MIFDKTVLIKQLTVVEAHGILLVRTDRGLFNFKFQLNNLIIWWIAIDLKGRDSRMHVFRLSSFESDACGSEPAALSRQNLKEQRLERTKGTHLYAVSRLGGSHLRVVSFLVWSIDNLNNNERHHLIESRRWLWVRNCCCYSGAIRRLGRPGVLQATRTRSRAFNIFGLVALIVVTQNVTSFVVLLFSSFFYSFRPLNDVDMKINQSIDQGACECNFIFRFLSAISLRPQRSFNWANRQRWWRSSIQAPVSQPAAKETTKSASATATSSISLTSAQATRADSTMSTANGPI